MYLEAVLIGHDLLGLALVGALGGAAGALGGQRAAGGPAATLAQVQLRHLHADLIAHDVLELRRR